MPSWRHRRPPPRPAWSDDGVSQDTATAAVRPAAVKPLVPGMRRLLSVAAVLVLLAGFQLFVFTHNTAGYFPLALPNPPGAPVLGAGCGGCVALGALRAPRRGWGHGRTADTPGVGYT